MVERAEGSPRGIRTDTVSGGPSGLRPASLRSPLGGSARGTWGAWAIMPALIALLSRGYSVALVFFANAHSHPHRRNPFAAWDAEWYIRVAQRGYHATPQALSVTNLHYDFAFFPLWPVAIHLSTLGVLPAVASSVLLANVLFVAAAVLTWRLLAERFDAALATRALLLLAFSPAAYVFSLAYSEPLFLLLAAAYFLNRGKDRRQGVLAFLAMLARIAGAAIVASAACVALRTRGPERRAALLAIAAGCAGFAAWWIFIALLMQNPFGFMLGSPSWGRSAGVIQILDLVRHHDPRRIAALAFTALVFLGALLSLRRDCELGVYAVTAVALGLLPGGLISSMPRYSLIAFPAFAGLAQRLGRRGTFLAAVAFAAAQWWFVSWSFVFPHVQPP